MVGSELIEWIIKNELEDSNVDVLTRVRTGEHSDPDYKSSDDITLNCDEGNITIYVKEYIND